MAKGATALTRGSIQSLRLYDLSDKEIAGIVADVRDDAGWAARTVITGKIFPYSLNGNGKTERGKHAMRCVAIRLAWLRRFGVVEKMAKRDLQRMNYDLEDSYWGLTVEGELFLRGGLTSQQRRVLDGLPDDGLIAATSALTDRYVSAGGVGANLMRREWLYGVNRRNGIH